jgi:hypothetical protein
MARMKDEVLGRIHSAFCNVPRPKDDELQWHPDSMDEIWIDSFIGDSDMNWWQISGEKIDYECNALGAFSPRAYAYYLPAYMTWVLMHYETSDSNTVDHTLYDLDLLGASEERDHRARSLTVEQSKAVLEFLKFMNEIGAGRVDSAAAKRAIESYWGKFEEPLNTNRGRKNRDG